MGLDMYLRVERTLEPDSATERAVLEARQVSRPALIMHLRQMNETDPDLYDGIEYLSMWEFTEEAKRQQAMAIVAAAGLAAFVDTGSPSGRLGYDVEADAFVVGVTGAYWRKANAIHAWFVDNVQGGEDECEPHEVQAEQLIALKMLATTLENATAEECARHLPPRQGFFFGGYEIDEWYRDDLRYTATRLDYLLKTALAMPEPRRLRFIYQSSW